MRRHRLQPRARDSERTWKLTLLELGNRGPPTARCDETYFEETTEGNLNHFYDDGSFSFAWLFIWPFMTTNYYFEETTEGIFKPFLKWFFFIRMAVYMAFHDDESWRVARCSLI